MIWLRAVPAACCRVGSIVSVREFLDVCSGESPRVCEKVCAGSVIADLQVALWQAVAAKDLAAAQGLNDRIYPMVQAFYAPPFLDMHNRMKEALVLLGRLKRAVVRPPLMKLPAGEIARLKTALAEARITTAGAFGLAA